MIEIAVIEQNPIYREGLVRILSQAGYTVRFFGNDVHEFDCDKIRDVFPLLFIVDLDAVDLQVHQLVDLLHSINSRAQVVCLANAYDEVLMVRALGAGVSALLRKQISCEVLVKSLELVILGERLFPVPCLGMKSIEPASVPHDDTDTVVNRLSARELEVLDCLSIGNPNKVIARKFGITEATVKVHVKAILRKIPAHNRTEAAMWAKKYGVHSATAFDPNSLSQIDIAEAANGGGFQKPFARFVRHHSRVD